MRGFTLLELVVAIGIISVLLLIAFPVYGRSRAEARRVVCSQNLRSLHTAMTVYVEGNFSSYPKLASKKSASPDKTSLRDCLTPLVGDERAFKCPEDNQKFFEKEGSSYEWNALLNGVSKDGPITDVVGPSRTPMIYDYENFHRDPGNGFGGKNVVFCDGHIEH